MRRPHNTNFADKVSDEGGYVEAMTPILVGILLLFVMLLYNTGQQITAVRQLDNAAQSAARAAATQIDQAALSNNIVRLNPANAIDAAQDHMVGFGVSRGRTNVTLNAARTVVTVNVRQPFQNPWYFASFGNGGTKQLRAQAVATVDCGIRTASDTECAVLN